MPPPDHAVPPDGGAKVREQIDAVYRSDSRRVLATLIRLLGDFDLAEEALQDAFTAALEQWSTEGFPANPRAWLISCGRFKALDKARRRNRHDEISARLSGHPMYAGLTEFVFADDDEMDDRLRLIFTCCHPALSQEAQVALTLRTVCSLTTEAIADAYLVPAPTLAQRIVRAKAKIRDARIPYETPERTALPERLDAVLQVVYLVFTEGHSPSRGPDAVRADLATEAIRLGRLLADLLDDAEVKGLLALMLLHDARRGARTDANGDLVLLDAQDRALWDQEKIAEGIQLTQQALRVRPAGAYAVQAAIAAVHAEATTAAGTDWPQIVALYDVLRRAAPSPVVDLNRAVAVAMVRGADAGLALIDDLMRGGALDGYVDAHSARAELLRRTGRGGEAARAFRRALELVEQEPERRFLQTRLATLERSETTRDQRAGSRPDTG